MPERAVPDIPDKPSIAVLPFQNMSGDPEQEYFADGMVEDIITALSRFKSLFVIARNSSFTYKGRAVDIKQVGLELGVRYVLEGSVRKAGGRVRITGQLIEAASGVHLWADHFDGALEDVFDLQDNVAESVVSTIFAEVQRAEIALSRHKPTDRLDAYDCFLRSIASTRPGDREVNDVALRWAYKAIELDPEFGAAYARAAQCYSNRKQSRWMKHVPTESAEGVRLARLAIQYAGNDATALAHAGMVIGYVGGEVEEGLLYTERAISLNSNSDRAWVSSGWLNLYLGNHETSIAHIAKALRLSPRAPERAMVERRGVCQPLLRQSSRSRTAGRRGPSSLGNASICAARARFGQRALGRDRAGSYVRQTDSRNRSCVPACRHQGADSAAPSRRFADLH